MDSIGGGADTEIWFPNCFLIMSIKMAEGNCWAKGKRGDFQIPEGREGEKIRDSDQAVEWIESCRHVGLLGHP